ncbi:xylulokinase [soil metagenome]
MSDPTADPVLVAGIDLSTQSTKVVLVDVASGAVVDEASAPHPPGTEVDPEAWWEALSAAGAGLLDRAAAVAVAGQQHGMVTLDAEGAVVRPALLWNDLRSAPQADALVAELGGPDDAVAAVGSVLTASYTVAKLRWVAEHEPEAAAGVAAVALPHDWLTWRLDGSPDLDRLTTDAGDASGTGYFDPAARAWRPELLQQGLGHDAALPRLAGPAEIVGHTPHGAAIAPGTGDNMAAALGLGLEPGDVAVSIGTSGTAFAVSPTPVAGAGPEVCGFCDATGRHLPLVCTVNASRILSTTAAILGLDLDAFDTLALSAVQGANGVTFLPYLDGERTPNRPDATGVLNGITSATAPADIAGAAVEALLCSLADAVDALGVPARRILMIGGGSRSEAVRTAAPAFFGTDVVVPAPAEYVALGAARQAAWALSGTPEPPAWPVAIAEERSFDGAARSAADAVRARYAALRDHTAGWS